jgi:hypothetical protein
MIPVLYAIGTAFPCAAMGRSHDARRPARLYCRRSPRDREQAKGGVF